MTDRDEQFFSKIADGLRHNRFSFCEVKFKRKQQLNCVYKTDL